MRRAAARAAQQAWRGLGGEAAAAAATTPAAAAAAEVAAAAARQPWRHAATARRVFSGSAPQTRGVSPWGGCVCMLLSLLAVLPPP